MPNINSFSITNIKGMMDLMVNANVISARVKSDEATDLVNAQAVKLVDTDGKLPVVTAITNDSDDVFGFVNYNQKNATFAAGLPLEISAYQGNIMYMEAGAAFAPGTQLMPVVVGHTVITATVSHRIIGRALDKASAAGDIVRVYINLPGALA